MYNQYIKATKVQGVT